MYNYDTIPLKLYFKIIETGDISLIGKGTEIEQSEALEEITNERQVSSEDEYKGRSKELDVRSRMEYLASKYKAIQYSVYYLRLQNDNDLIEMLKSKGYKFSDDLQKDLDAIEKISEGLVVKIEAIKNRLPKQKENSKKEPPIDQVVLSYCALLEMGFVDTNKITLSQYDSMVEIGNRKMESLNKVSDGRK